MRGFLVTLAVLVPCLALAGDPGGGTSSGDSSDTVSGGEVSSGIVASGACATQPDGATICYDNVGVVQGQSSTTTDPLGVLIRAGACAPTDATCTAAPVCICGGQDTSTITIDDYTNGSGATVTLTVTDRSCASTATVLTEGTDYDAETDDDTTASNLAAAIVAADIGVGSTAVAEVAGITLDQDTCSVTLAEDTAAYTTVATGTRGALVVTSSRVLENGLTNLQCGDADGDSGIAWASDDEFRLRLNGVNRVVWSQSTSTWQVAAPFEATGSVTFSRATNLGWSIQSSANQAGDTTCTNACVLCWETSSGEVAVSCTDATADKCLCAGSS